MRTSGILTTALILAACAPSAEMEPGGARAQATGEAMVNTANPHASAAGAEILQQGGNAVDAAIASHAVLGLTEPQSSGLGGGGFMLVYHDATGKTEALDGRETAPANAYPEMFLDAQGAPLSHKDRVQSGHSIGVPGAVSLYALAHERHGSLPWKKLFAPAIKLARDGFEVSPRLHQSLKRIAGYTNIAQHEETADYFFPDGEPAPVGYLLRNPDYADILTQIARSGSSAFYQGKIPRAMVSRAAEPPRPGTLTVSDIQAYKSKVRQPVCAPYRQYQVCTMPPPSSGVALLEILGLLERLAPEGLDNDSQGWAKIIDAMLLAYADRDHYVADADFVPVPVADLINPAYLDARVGQLRPAGTAQVPGDPGAILRNQPMLDRWGMDATDERAGTSHLSVIDGAGNAVAFTATVEFAFGSGRMISGFILNNELTDFSSLPSLSGKPVANAVAPGKRPRSSMVPSMVFNHAGELVMVTGSPGGNSIIAYTAKSIIGVLDFGMSVQQAVALPNVVARNLPVRIEHTETSEALVEGLKRMGYPIDLVKGENSGLHPIVVRGNGRLEAAADPRREGVAIRVEASKTGK